MLKQARNRETSKLPKVSQVTVFSRLEQSLTQATPLLLWLLPLYLIVESTHGSTLFKIAKIILNYDVNIENILYIK